MINLGGMVHDETNKQKNSNSHHVVFEAGKKHFHTISRFLRKGTEILHVYDVSHLFLTILVTLKLFPTALTDIRTYLHVMGRKDRLTFDTQGRSIIPLVEKKPLPALKTLARNNNNQ